MIACTHFRLKWKVGSRDKVYIHQSEGYPWNAWVYVYDENDNLVWQSFETGEYDVYIAHLIENKKCRKEVGIDLRELKKIQREINETWVAVMGGDP